MTVLIVNHSKENCGVYQFGKRVANLAMKSTKVNFKYVEINSMNELSVEVANSNPTHILYNWYPVTMEWLGENYIQTHPEMKHYFLFHDGHMRHNYDKYIFSGSIGKDINIPPEKTVVLPRPLFNYTETYPTNTIPTIGSFGFGGWQKGFPDITKYVAQSFSKAIVNILMPFAYYGDRDGVETRKIAEHCHALNTYPGIELNIKHDFCSDEEVLTFLAGNDLNIFLYVSSNQGLSSVIDYALSVKRPIAIRNDSMFKHIYKDEICVDSFSIKDIIENGTTPLQEYYNRWSQEKFIAEIEELFV